MSERQRPIVCSFYRLPENDRHKYRASLAGSSGTRDFDSVDDIRRWGRDLARQTDREITFKNISGNKPRRPRRIWVIYFIRDFSIGRKHWHRGDILSRHAKRGSAEQALLKGPRFVKGAIPRGIVAVKEIDRDIQNVIRGI